MGVASGPDSAGKRAWQVWSVLGGLAAVFAGGRIFANTPGLRVPLILAGAAAVLVATVWQCLAWRRATGDLRRTEAVFALAFAGTVLALAGYLFGTESGTQWLGLDFDNLRTELRFRRFFLVASTVILACAVLSAVAGWWALRKGGSPAALHVDTQRVRETAGHAFSLALAGSGLMLLGYVAGERNHTLDFSYFKTSTPGDAVREIVRNLDGDLQAALFFPQVNPVKDEVLTYLRELQNATGRVTIQEHDRFADPAAAADFRARRDGEVFLRVGTRTEQISLSVEMNEARGRLRTFDGLVQQALLMLAREQRVAYMTKGHGELNAPLDIYGEPEEKLAPWQTGERWRPGMDLDPSAPDPAAALRQMLELLNYDARDLGLPEGLGDRIPDDAAMVMILGPDRPFLEPEANAIREYVDRGGSLLIALEAGSEFRLADFRDRLGLDHDPVMMIDDQRHFREQGTAADRRYIVTNRFSTHPSVTTASRQGTSSGLLMVGPGVITPVEDTEGLRTTLIVRSLPSSFADRNGNFRFDEDSEVRDSYGLAAAVERETTDRTTPELGDAAADSLAAGEPSAPAPAMRALVFGDSEIFEDRVLTTLGLNAAVVADGIRWLGREETFAGEVVSEEDVPIVHTRSEDVAWFYAIIFGAPLLVLGGGAAVLYARRRQKLIPDDGGAAKEAA